MEILARVLAIPAFASGVLILATLACTNAVLGRQFVWLKLTRKALLYTILALFLFFSYTVALSMAISASYDYFVVVFTSLFACTSFLIPKLIVKLFGVETKWFARSVGAYGYAFVLLTFAALLVRELPLSATVPKSGLLVVGSISVGLFILPRLIRSRAIK